MTPRVVVIGWVSLDTLRLPGSQYESPGGAALYSSLASVKYTSTGLVARVGSDYPEMLIAQWQALRLDTRGVIRVPGQSTRFMVSYDDDWTISYDQVAAGVGTGLTSADFPIVYIGVELLLIAPMHPDLQQIWVDFASDRGIQVALGTSHLFTGIPELRQKILGMIRRSHAFACNLNEAKHLFGIEHPDQAVAALGNYVPMGIITLDKRGVEIIHDNRMTHYAALPATVLDPSGAGDVFVGSFLGYWIEHRNVDQAARLALEDAARVVSAPGIAALVPGAVQPVM